MPICSPRNLIMVSLLVGVACTSGGKKKSDSEPVKSDSKESAKEAKDDGPHYASANRVTLTSSWTNSPLTSHTVSSSKAEQEFERFKSGGKKEKRVLEGRISAGRLARKSLGEVLSSAKDLAELEMQKGADRSVSQDVKLEIALAALDAKNFSLAEYYLQELTSSKDARVKAGAFNAMGVVALRDDRVPEAVLYFRESLKAVSNYRPALLNLGFAALKGGDISTAKKAFSDMQNDWFVQYGLISVSRIDGNEGAVQEHCERVLKKEPQHAPALFNCGLFEYQNKKNVAKAKDYFTKVTKVTKNLDPTWSERAFLVMNQIEQEEAQTRREEAKKKAEKAQAAQKAKAEQAKSEKAEGGSSGGGEGKGAETPEQPAAGGAPAK